jgi:hypothetical protein
MAKKEMGGSEGRREAKLVARLLGSSLGSNPVISRKCKNWRHKQEWPTHSSPPKKLYRREIFWLVL